MNAKKAKELRTIAMNSLLPGEPLRQLVLFKQVCTPRTGPDGKTYTPVAHGAVNNPKTFRGRYRNLKSGRVIDTKRIEAAAKDIEFIRTSTTTAQQAQPTHPKPNWLQKLAQKLAQKFSRVFARKRQ